MALAGAGILGGHAVELRRIFGPADLCERMKRGGSAYSWSENLYLIASAAQLAIWNSIAAVLQAAQ